MDKKIAFIIIGVVAAVGALFIVFGRNPFVKTNILAPVPQAQTPASVAPTIVKAVASRSIDAKGNATGETASFNSKTDKIVYAALTLKNATTKTKLSYARYLNGKYIDSKVAQPSKDGITAFYFTFEKGIGDYPKGTYNLKFYVDGRRTIETTYVFK